METYDPARLQDRGYLVRRFYMTRCKGKRRIRKQIRLKLQTKLTPPELPQKLQRKMVPQKLQLRLHTKLRPTLPSITYLQRGKTAGLTKVRIPTITLMEIK